MGDVGIGLTTISPVASATPSPRAKDELADPFVYAERSEGYFEEAVAQVYHRYQRPARQRQRRRLRRHDRLLRPPFPRIPRPARLLPGPLSLHPCRRSTRTPTAPSTSSSRQLAEGRGNVCVVGDDDQSIYTWRGADIRNILDFEAQFADSRVIRLERNYRSTGNILASANAVISKVANRAEKTLWTERDDGQQPEIIEAFDEDDEARQVGNLIRELRGEDIPSHDIAIHLPHQPPSPDPLEEWFVRQGLPYQLVGATEFYGRREVRDVLALLAAIANPRDLVSFERIANTPRAAASAPRPSRSSASGTNKPAAPPAN